MEIEFSLHKIKPGTKTAERFMNKFKTDSETEFIVVGEQILSEKKYLMLIPVENCSIHLIDGLKLDEMGYMAENGDVVLATDEKGARFSIVCDIPKKYLNMGVYEKIKNLNPYFCLE